MRQTCVRILAIATLAGLLPAAAATTALAHDREPKRGQQKAKPADPKPLAPGGTYRGLTYGEWQARWWLETFATLEAQEDPFAIFKGAYGGSNDIVFLAGAIKQAESPKVKIPITVPSGAYLFVPIVTVECSVAEGGEFHGETEPELRACANGLLDLVTGPYASIDGKPVKNAAAYRSDTPLFRYGPLAQGNVLMLPPGTQSNAVGAGYFLLLPPLSPGDHRIVVRAEVPAVGYDVDAEFFIKVEAPKRKSRQ
ncbi:MAG TPA: hypothetical protein VIL35_08630 [Vicinamibacterales bacterium]